MSRMHLLDQQIANMKQEIIDEEGKDNYPEQDSENSGDEEDAFFTDFEEHPVNIVGADGFKGNIDRVGKAEQLGHLRKAEQVGQLRKADLAAVGWDSNNALVFGSQFTIEMANVINYNASVTAQEQGELDQAEGGIERLTNIEMEVKKATKSLEQLNSVVLEEGLVRTIGPSEKDCRSTSSENKENESPENCSKRVRKSPTDSRWSNGARPPSKWAKAVYIPHTCLPLGWTFYDNEKGQVFFRNAVGKFIKNRRYALQEMLSVGGPLNAQGANAKFTEREITFIRDGLTFEGWRYAEPEGRLPYAWLFKTYTHRIEGVDTDVMYLLSPNGSIVRSKARLKRDFRQLGVSEADLRKLLEFKPEDFHGPDDVKTLENPDDQWVYDPEVVPEGWLVKKYTFNSSHSKKVEEVFHYLTPCRQILRGRRQVFDYLSRTGTYSTEAFNKFPFNREAAAKAAREVSLAKWGEWEDAMGLPDGWKVRTGEYQSTLQKKKQYKSPLDQIFPSKFQVMRYLREGGHVTQTSYRAQRQKKLRKSAGAWAEGTVWAEWRTDNIPCLPGWQFSVGREDNRRKIRYKSPEGRVFHSRGPLIRYLYENNLKKKQQLKTLKRLLKTNQGLRFEESRRNDRFIKHLDVDWNFLLFLRQRYDNHVDLPESIDPKLPEGWRVKNINGVEYFKIVDESGPHVFNTRRLVVNYLRQRKFEVADDELMDILEESDAESELTESGEGEEEGEVSEEEEEERLNQKPLQVQAEERPCSVQDLGGEQLHGGGFGCGGESGGWSSKMLLKQEVFEQADIGWLEQHYPKVELSNVQIKEEEPGRRRSRGN